MSKNTVLRSKQAHQNPQRKELIKNALLAKLAGVPITPAFVNPVSGMQKQAVSRGVEESAKLVGKGEEVVEQLAGKGGVLSKLGPMLRAGKPYLIGAGALTALGLGGLGLRSWLGGSAEPAPAPGVGFPVGATLGGAGVGALSGLGYSLLFGDSETRKKWIKNTLLGALIGGAGGAAVGYLM